MRIQSWFGMMNPEKRFLKLSRNLKTGNYEEVIILNDRQILVSLSFSSAAMHLSTVLFSNMRHY